MKMNSNHVNPSTSSGSSPGVTFALAPRLLRIPPAAESLGTSQFRTLTIPFDANAAQPGDCGIRVDLRNLIACSSPGCTTLYRAGEQLTRKAKYICRNHSRQDQVEAFQEYVPERRGYDSTKDRQDAHVHFQEYQLEIKKTKPGDLHEFRPKRFCIALPRFNSHGMPVSAGLNAQMDFDVSLPYGWFDSYPAGDPRGLPDSKRLHLAEESEWSKQTRRAERDTRARTRKINFKTWVNELPPDEQPSADAYRIGAARRFTPEREFGSKDFMLFYALPSLVDLPEAEFLKACAERKKLNRATSKLLREVRFFSLGESVYLGPMDPRDTCPRCGCQFYTQDDNGELRCHDCHLHLRESEPESEAEESDVVERGERAIERNLPESKVYDPHAGRTLRPMTKN